MIKNAVVNARVEAALKEEAAQILAEFGLTLSEAIHLFLKMVKLHRGLPFDVRIPELENLSETDKAFVQAGIDSIHRNRKLIDLLAK